MKHPIQKLIGAEAKRQAKLRQWVHDKGPLYPRHPISYQELSRRVSIARERALLEALHVSTPKPWPTWRQLIKRAWWVLRYGLS